MTNKQLLCDFYPYCAKGNGCSKRLTVDIFNKAIAADKPIGRSDYFRANPLCFVEKVKHEGLVR